jgi:flagellar motor switch protein FliM
MDKDFSLPVFSPNDRLSRLWSQIGPQIERLHDAFMGQWRQALNAIVPGGVEIDGLGIDCQPYSTFVKEAAAFSDIQVYEVEALQSLCAWSLDVNFVPAAVDTMFGGTGRARLHEIQRRQHSPIESGVRRRLFESLATAYESAWQGLYPIRLNALRQEALLSSLRLTAAAEQVVHARFRIELNGHGFALALCWPLRALEVLSPVTAASTTADTSHGPVQTSAQVEALPHRLQDAPVEVVAMLGELQLTVAQLMSLSIGQVVPFQMNELVPLQVDGVHVVSGPSGVRNGRHAVKVQLSAPVNLQGMQSKFMPLIDEWPPLHPAPSTTELPSAGDDSVPTVSSPLTNAPEESRHEPDPFQ